MFNGHWMERAPTSHLPRPKGNPDFPLRGFVLCATCGKGLTGGHATGQEQGEARTILVLESHVFGQVGVSKEHLETNWVRLLAMYQPTEEFIAQSGKIAMKAWEQRQARTAEDSRALSIRFARPNYFEPEIDTRQAQRRGQSERF
jgi:hypothetical protein